MKKTPINVEPATPFENFDQLFRNIIAVPKSAVEKEEAKARLKNRKQRAKRKKADKKSQTG
ncbi:MAG TPA: hypothetical protein VGN86_00235 [Pyrinomonadaceae bacterium]|jgi:hypothetical protein|nr:hypothetical protein [Pyrinomonadaceae bacterium]